MRKLLILVFLGLISVACASDKGAAVLTFHVDGPTAPEVVLVCHGDVLTCALDADGNAEVVLDGYDAAYARLFYGRDFRWIYFEKGDNAEVIFKGNDFVGSFVFEGEKKPAVEYLNSVKLTALPDEDFSLPFEEYHARILKKTADAVKLMKANGVSSAGDFEKMEEARIKYAYGAPLLMYPVGHKVMAGDMSYVPDAGYYDVIGSYLEDSGYLADIDEFRTFSVEAAHVLDEDNRNVTGIYPKTVAQMTFIADRFKDEKVRQVLIHYLASSYVDNFGTDDIVDMENIYRTYVKDAKLTEAFDMKCVKWDLTAAGRPSPDFMAYDLDGREWTLADFRGRYVYVDMWATWCGPCRKEMPSFRKLAESFSDAEIVFLGLSVDSDRNKWAEMVEKGDLAGTQLYLGTQSGFQKAYKVESIPRFILLDRQGRIISNDMTRPSDPQTAVTLNSLNGIR